MSLLSRFQLPYPLLKMSFADFPRSAYAGGTAILPVIQVEQRHASDTQQVFLSFDSIFRNSIGKLILLLNMAWKHCTFSIIQSWYRAYM